MSKLSAALKKLTRKLQPVDYFAAYECTVKAVDSDGNLDLEPFDERLKSGPQHVEIKAPAGYEKIVPKVGSVCMMSFKNGSPSAPFVEFFSLDATFSEVAIRADKITLNDGTAAVARKGDLIGTLTGVAGMTTVMFTLAVPGSPPITAPAVQLKISGGNESVKA
jgi:hypothetical protein